MRTFVVEVYEDNDITDYHIFIELSGKFGNMIAGVKETTSTKTSNHKCECMLEDCNTDIPEEEYLELRKKRYLCVHSGFITLKGHYDPEINKVIAETEHLVLREYTDGRYEEYDE